MSFNIYIYAYNFFNFFLYIVLNEYNKIKTEGLYELFNNQLSKFPSKKRTYAEMVEENNDDAFCFNRWQTKNNKKNTKMNNNIMFP